MSDTHPTSLRPGGPSPSNTPRPESQSLPEDMQGRQQYAYGANQESQSGQQQSANYGSRFPSQIYAAQGPDFGVDTPGGSSSNHPNHPYGGNGGNDARSRSSTIGQSYPVTMDQSSQPSMPGAQPLFAQHSGQAAGMAGQSGSRPVSRHNPGGPSQAMNPSVLQPNFSSGQSTRPGTAGGTQSQSKSPFTTPVTSPPRSRPSQILLINPTSSTALTNTMLSSLRPILPPQLEVVGYTAHYPAPTATETTVDQALSTELVLRDLAKYATNNGETVQNFDALLVASFTQHPLINALRESYDVPVIGVMEGSLYVSRMLGARFGVLSTTNRHKIQTDDALHMSGLGHYFVGAEAVHMSPIEILASASQSQTGALPEEVSKRIAHAARALVSKGADTLVMGSESMSSLEVIRAAKDAIREEDGRRTINVVDCVEAGVMCLNALVGMGVPTSKKGVYRGERDGRRARGQNWL
ncbi:hypothetical protein LTR70_009046 [Exophiala xenobiotica]|uniref:Uncharacterized protein n=1 Tax=Lithohypha guttulata TaxID=1690604 RepID=A0ABR0JZ80_9EURO|nr:hypothetical protein LTR24_008743 [Lithohypha guttulata]KAK5311096.1 hypothetical protein LTR70_009046 [Exophiala xenobiotica]